MADVQWTGVAAEQLGTDELRQYWHLAVTAGELGGWQWDLETREIQCSARAASLLGLPGAGTVGPDVFAACFDQVDQGKVALVLDDAAEGQEIAIEATLTKPYGVKGRLRLVATASRDAGGFPRRVLGLLIPMDHPTQIEETSRWLATIVASSDDAIISKTVDGIVTSWNRGAERVFGYTADEMVGNSISVLAVPHHEKEMPAIVERLRRGEKVDHYETTRQHKDGTIRHISLTVSPIHDEEGRVVGASKIARDITQARLAAEALSDAQRRLQEEHHKLLHVARLSELGQMAATMAHEVNQPLTAIGNYLRAARRLLAASDPASRRKLDEALDKAADQAVRAGEIIRRLRSLAKRGESNQRPEAIAQIVDEAVSLAAVDARPRGVHVQLELDPAAALVLADRVQIQQVLLNLVRNALEAMEGHPRRELRIITAARKDVVEVSVADTGPGLAPQVAEKLFQPFVTTKGGGMGIGLSICRAIVDSHGGRLWVEDNPGGGTIFRFTLRSLPSD